MPRFTLLLLLFLAIAPASAQEPIRFPRSPDISPDGKQVAFSYLGDIWVVEAIGGVARPVTMHEAHDYAPVFSPDGRSLAFSSNRAAGSSTIRTARDPRRRGCLLRLVSLGGGDAILFRRLTNEFGT